MVLVSVLMPTYNHEKYISQAIESFLKQKTNFKIELLINDDCSTDSTLSIAQSYQKKFPSLIKIFAQKENRGLLSGYKTLIQKSQGKYLSILESDDYYIDEYKLQKQVDFLENNPDYGLIGTDFIKVNEQDKIIEATSKRFHENLNGEWYSHFLLVQELGAITVCFSKALFEKYCNIDDYIKNKFQTFDYPVWLTIAKHSKCKYLNEITAAYRIIPTSISNNSSFEKRIKFQDSISDIQKYIIAKYGFGDVSEKLFFEQQLLSYIDIAIQYNKFFYYLNLTRKLKSNRMKLKIMHYLPTLWYIQHKIRIGDKR